VAQWYGVRVFTDAAANHAPLPDQAILHAILRSEEQAGRTDPYRHVAALLHLIAVRENEAPVSLTPALLHGTSSSLLHNEGRSGTSSSRREVDRVSVDRFGTLLYGIGEAAGYLAVPPSTLTNWAYGYERRRAGARGPEAKPIITAVRPHQRDAPAVPFIGLAEAYALAAFRSAGVPMQRIRPAIDALSSQLGLEYALASKRLYTDGAEVLYDYARHAGDTPEGESARELVVVRNSQRVFSEVVDLYLRRIDFARDGYAQLIRLPQYRVAEVTVDPDHAFGRPRFSNGGASVDDVIDLFRAGEPVDAVAGEFGLSRDEVEDAIRVATRAAT
jgi:uncharacterized protein (DUF433 family)